METHGEQLDSLPADKIEGPSNRLLTRRGFLAAGAVATAGGLLAACGSNSSNSSKPNSGTSGSSGPGSGTTKSGSTVTINMFGTIGLYYYQQNFDAYEKTHPNVKFQYHVFPFTSYDDVISSHMETHDGSYSLYEVDEPRIPQFTVKKWVVPITSPTRAQLSKLLLAEQLDEVTYNGEVVGLPESTSTQFLYYNKDLVNKAHLTAPPLNVAKRWTWPQLYDAAVSVQKATGKSGLLFDQVNLIYQLQPLPQGLGGGPGVTGPNGLTPDVDNAAWIAAMEWYQKCFTSGVTPKSLTTSAQTAAAFQSGDAGFFWGGPWHYYPFAKQKGLNFGVAPQPHWAGHPAMTPTDSWALGLNPYGSNQDVALDFMKDLLLTTPGALIQLRNSSTAGGPGNPPANLAALKEYYKLWPKSVGALIQYELSNTAVHRARSLGWVQFETAIESAFTSISDGSSVKAALSNAQSTLKDQFSQIQTS
jgi:multiple sugar transport system substrate-binding protein